MASSLQINNNYVILQITLVSLEKSKRSGTLTLEIEKLVWRPERNKPQNEFSLEYGLIKMQKISGQGSKKVKLQLLLNTELSHTFIFNSSNATQDRTLVKDKLQVLIDQARTQKQEFQAKRQKLEDNPSLLQMYQELVVSDKGPLQADEFWAQHSDLVPSDIPQEIGMPTSFMCELQTEPNQDGEIKYKVTPEIIQNVFKMYPAVRKKHTELVPTTISESVFWSEVIQSLQFHGLDIPGGSKTTKCQEATKIDEQNRLKSDLKRIKAIPEMSSLFGSEIDEPPLKRAQIIEETLPIAKSWIARTNYQNRMIVNSSGFGSASSSQQQILEGTELQYKPLTLSKQILTLNQNASSKKLKDYTLPTLNRWQPNFTQAMTHSRSLQSISELSPGGSFIPNIQPIDSIPQNVSSDVESLFHTSTELLRHFWGCFPVTNSSIEDKLKRLTSSLQQFPVTHIRPFRIKHGNSASSVLIQLENSINHSLKRYQAWLSRRKKN